MNIEQAVDTLADGFRDSPGFREGWQANIAMAFFDEMQRFREASGKRSPNRRELHQISNQAADTFLKWLEAPKVMSK